jgi:hypothetical protein
LRAKKREGDEKENIREKRIIITRRKKVEGTAWKGNSQGMGFYGWKRLDLIVGISL